MSQSPLTPQDFLKAAEQAIQHYKENKPAYQAQVVKDRKKNFKGGFVSLLAAFGFLGIGFWMRSRVFFVYWYIWMGIAGLIGFVAVFSIISNAWLIIRERGK